MSYTNNDLDLARALFGRESTTTASPGTGSAQTNTYFGWAQTDSKDGMVMVVIDGDVLSASGQAVNLKTTVNVKAGQRVIITVYGNSMVVTGVVGGGDLMAGDIQDAAEAVHKVNERYDELGNKVDEFGDRLDMTDEEIKEQAKTWERDLNDVRNSIHNFNVQYYVQQGTGTAPDVGTWVTRVPADSIPQSGQYLWSRIVSVNGLHEVVVTAKKSISNGQAMSAVPTTLYYLSTSETSPQGGTWEETIPAYEVGKWYWVRTRMYYAGSQTDSEAELVVFPDENTIQYVWEDSEGLHVAHANPIESSTPNTLLTGTSLQMRYGTQVLGSFATAGVELMNGMAKFTPSEVTLNNGMGRFTSTSVQLCNGSGEVLVNGATSELPGLTLHTNTIPLSIGRGVGSYYKEYVHLDSDLGVRILSNRSRGEAGVARIGLNADRTGGGNVGLVLQGDTGNLYLSGTSGDTATADTATFHAGKLATNLKGGRVLYSNATGTTGAVSLSMSAANFGFLQVVFRNSTSGSHNDVIISDPNGRYFDMITYFTSTNPNRVAICCRSSTISGSSINAGTEWYASIPDQSNPGAGAQATRRIYIVKVIGYYTAT